MGLWPIRLRARTEARPHLGPGAVLDHRALGEAVPAVALRVQRVCWGEAGPGQADLPLPTGHPAL